MKKLILLFALYASASFNMDSIKYFETSDTKSLMLILQKHAATLFHPQQPEPIVHALLCANSSNFTTYLHITGDTITGAISMGIFNKGKNNFYGIINFLIFEKEEIGTLLFDKIIKTAKFNKLSSLTIFNLRTNTKLRDFCIRYGGKPSHYISKIQEVFDFTP